MPDFRVQIVGKKGRPIQGIVGTVSTPAGIEITSISNENGDLRFTLPFVCDCKLHLDGTVPEGRLYCGLEAPLTASDIQRGSIDALPMLRRIVDPVSGRDTIDFMRDNSMVLGEIGSWRWAALPIRIAVPESTRPRVLIPLLCAIEDTNKVGTRCFEVVSALESNADIDVEVTEKAINGACGSGGSFMLTKIRVDRPLHGVLKLSSWLLPHHVQRLVSHELVHALGFAGHEEERKNDTMHPEDPNLFDPIASDDLVGSIATARELSNHTWDDAAALLERCFVSACSHADSEACAYALWSAGMLYRRFGRQQYCSVCFDEALVLAHGDVLRAAILDSLAQIDIQARRYEDARNKLAHSVHLAHQAGDELGAIGAMSNVAFVQLMEEDWEACEATGLMCLERLHETGYYFAEYGAAVLHSNVSMAQFRQGKVAEAKASSGAAFELAMGANMVFLAAEISWNCADVAAYDADVVSEIRWLRSAMELFQQGGDDRRAANTAERLFWTARPQADLENVDMALRTLEILLTGHGSRDAINYALIAVDWAASQDAHSRHAAASSLLRSHVDDLDVHEVEAAQARFNRWREWSSNRPVPSEPPPHASIQ